MIASQLAWEDDALRGHPASSVARQSEKKPGLGFEASPDHDEVLRCVLLQMTLCGALINRDAIEFARGVAEVLVWSAEHARVRALRQQASEETDAFEWPCVSCGASVPDNFDLCWNCEMERPAQR